MGKRINKYKDAFRDQTNMTYKRMKQHCVVRGMPFEDVVSGSFPTLGTFLNINANIDIDTSLLDEFDDWQDAQIKDPNMIHESLRLGYIGERGEDGEVKKVKRIPGLKKTKKKRERTESGVFSGTKKALTYKLQLEGISKEETIKSVLEQFPDGKEKSISIWWKKSKRENNKE